MDDVDGSALHRSISVRREAPAGFTNASDVSRGNIQHHMPPRDLRSTFSTFDSSHLDLDPFRAEALDELGEDPRVGLNRRP